MLRNILAILTGLFSMSVSAQDFEAGQIWQYKTRIGEEHSRLYIVKVEAGQHGEKIYHIYADGLKIENNLMSGGIQSVLPHAPVSLKTLELSVTKLQGKTNNPPDISEGYAAWKEQYDTEGAGVFIISVSEIINLIEGVVAKHAKKHS